jgi:hypothetical protein
MLVGVLRKRISDIYPFADDNLGPPTDYFGYIEPEISAIAKHYREARPQDAFALVAGIPATNVPYHPNRYPPEGLVGADTPAPTFGGIAGDVFKKMPLDMGILLVSHVD